MRCSIIYEEKTCLFILRKDIQEQLSPNTGSENTPTFENDLPEKKRTGICKRYHLYKNQNECLLFIFGYGCLQQKNNGLRIK